MWENIEKCLSEFENLKGQARTWYWEGRGVSVMCLCHGLLTFTDQPQLAWYFTENPIIN